MGKDGTLQRDNRSKSYKALSEEEVAEVLEALIAAGHVMANGKKVTDPTAAN